MTLAAIEETARQALKEAGAHDVDVYVSEHRGAVQVLVSPIVAPKVAQHVQAALRSTYPDTVFDFVLP